MAYMKVKIASLVREYLAQHPDMSQAQFAVMADVNPATLSKYLSEDGSKSPDVHTIAKIMRYLGVTDANAVFEVVEDA